MLFLAFSLFIILRAASAFICSLHSIAICLILLFKRVLFSLHSIKTGEENLLFAIYFTVSSMVAEKSSFCVLLSTYSKILFISFSNPIENISSASSNTIVLKFDNLRLFFFKRSSILPGVPQTIFTPFLSIIDCILISCPP